MSKIYETLYRIAQGKPVKTNDERLACRWYGLRAITKKKAGSLWRKSHGKTS